jgi:hypothetical protein
MAEPWLCLAREAMLGRECSSSASKFRTPFPPTQLPRYPWRKSEHMVELHKVAERRSAVHASYSISALEYVFQDGHFFPVALPSVCDLWVSILWL